MCVETKEALIKLMKYFKPLLKRIQNYKTHSFYLIMFTLQGSPDILQGQQHFYY